MGTIHRWRWSAALQSCLDGEATSRRMAIVERHVADCPDCASEMELLHRMQDALARLGGADDCFDPAVARLRSHAAHLST